MIFKEETKKKILEDLSKEKEPEVIILALIVVPSSLKNDEVRQIQMFLSSLENDLKYLDISLIRL